MTSTQLQGQTVAFLTAQEGVEEVELTEPWKAVQEAGATPKLIAPESGEVQAFNHLDKSSTYPVDEALQDVDPDNYDATLAANGSMRKLSSTRASSRAASRRICRRSAPRSSRSSQRDNRTVRGDRLSRLALPALRELQAV